MKKIVQVNLSGGDADRLRGEISIWVDLDRGAAGGWAVLTTEDCAKDIAVECDAEIESIEPWDGEAFGDGGCGTVTLQGSKILFPSLSMATYVPDGYSAGAESEDRVNVETSLATATMFDVEGGMDVDVTVTFAGKEYEGSVTLVKDHQDSWVGYGDCPEMWVSGDLLDDLNRAAGERLAEVLNAVQDAAAAECKRASAAESDEATHELAVDDIVCAGRPGTDEFDVGCVVDVDLPGDDVRVAWSGGNADPIDVSDLRVIAKSGDPTHVRLRAQEECWANHRAARPDED